MRDALDAALIPSDSSLVEEFTLSIASYSDADGIYLSGMWQELCEVIDAMDGASVGREVARMTEALQERSDARARELLENLSPDGARTLMTYADIAVAVVNGSDTDVEAMARRYPEYVKRQYRDHCVNFGYLETY